MGLDSGAGVSSRNYVKRIWKRGPCQGIEGYERIGRAAIRGPLMAALGSDSRETHRRRPWRHLMLGIVEHSVGFAAIVRGANPKAQRMAPLSILPRSLSARRAVAINIFSQRQIDL